MEYALRRTNRGIGTDEALGILRRCTWGVLSLMGPDETPYGVPLNHALHEQGDARRLLFHCAREGRKLDCLLARPRAAFVAVEDAETLPDKFSTAFGSVMVSGPIKALDDPEEKRAALTLIVQRLAPGFRERGARHIEHRLHECCVLRLTIEHLCGKRRNKEEPYALAHLGF